MYHNPKIQTQSVTIMRVRRATHQGTLCHIIRSAWPKMESLQEENRGTKRQRLPWPWEKPLMTKEELARFAQGYLYERRVRGLTGKRVVLSPRPWLSEEARGARLAPRPPVGQPPAHLLRMQHLDKGGNDKEGTKGTMYVEDVDSDGQVHLTSNPAGELPEGHPRWNNLPPHLDSLQGDTQEKNCSML